MLKNKEIIFKVKSNKQVGMTIGTKTETCVHVKFIILAVSFFLIE